MAKGTLLKRISPMVFTLGAFKDKLDSISVEYIFVDYCHLTEIDTYIIAHEIIKFLIDKKCMEDF